MITHDSKGRGQEPSLGVIPLDYPTKATVKQPPRGAKTPGIALRVNEHRFFYDMENFSD